LDEQLSTQYAHFEFLVNGENCHYLDDSTDSQIFQVKVPAQETSHWTCSASKRIFDCACVLLALPLPLVIPVFAVVALAMRFTSPRLILFRQQRMGKLGQSFTIPKFRTMLHIEGGSHQVVAIAGARNFTLVGPFLRRWKLDELPQLFNVLAGHMSLVGPRPKMLDHSTFKLPCRPGITGAATIAFAREEVALSRVPMGRLDDLYHGTVLPAKQRIDSEYMSRATCATDVRLLVNTVLRRWDSFYLDDLIACTIMRLDGRTSNSGAPQAVSSKTKGDKAFINASATCTSRADAF
jgi:lipopolysaccharide/colanic/teichoic acid biosynthesis glycosyltransferase